MIYIRLLFAVFVPFYLGYLMTALILNKEEDCCLLERISLSYLIGTGVFSFYVFMVNWMGIRFDLLNVLLALLILLAPLQIVVLWKKSMFLNFKFNKPAPFSLIELALLIYVTLKLAYSFFEATVKPVTAWDAFAHHLFKSKALFLDQTISPATLNYIGGGLGYPMNIPINVSWIYVCLGQWNDALGQAIFPLLFFCAFAVFYSSLARYLSRPNVLIGSFIFTSLPFVVFHSTISYTDLPVAIYNLAAVLFLFNWVQTKNFKYVWIASLLSACALWTKNEAMGYTVINAAVFALPVLIEKKDKFKPLANIICAYLSTSLLVFFPWSLYKVLDKIEFAKTFERAGLINYFARIGPVVHMFNRKLFIDGNWNIFWYLFIILVIFKLMLIFRDRSKYLLALVFAYILFFFVYYLTASQQIYTFVFDGTVLCRNFMSFTLIAAFFLSYNLSIDEK